VNVRTGERGGHSRENKFHLTTCSAIHRYSKPNNTQTWIYISLLLIIVILDTI